MNKNIERIKKIILYHEHPEHEIDNYYSQVQTDALFGNNLAWGVVSISLLILLLLK